MVSFQDRDFQSVKLKFDLRAGLKRFGSQTEKIVRRLNLCRPTYKRHSDGSHLGTSSQECNTSRYSKCNCPQKVSRFWEM